MIMDGCRGSLPKKNPWSSVAIDSLESVLTLALTVTTGQTN